MGLIFSFSTMILSLRKRHRLIFSSMVLVLPVVFVAGILFRAAPKPTNAGPALQLESGATLARYIFETEDLWPAAKIITRVFADSLPPALLAVELQPQEAAALPEVLVYWKAGLPAVEAGSLQDAVLLGTLRGKQRRRLLLPQQAAQTDGHLLLFSLPHQSVWAQASLPIIQILQKGGKP
ncbi:MAG: hypothetical protein ACREOO_03020 [bacterium]